jgi:hypothetical protein
MSLFHMIKLLNGYDLAIELYDLRRGTSWIVRAGCLVANLPEAARKRAPKRQQPIWTAPVLQHPRAVSRAS